ncbi:late control protein [Lachnoanaerobaculum sp. Marseille-Q4761]|uniref:contractile injection system protein, VgrG/Pvc8 family n=1 Tax=Lachnoanaerobaculum sp. Marseille-Q4761 TaxID=2819511 RepID=UPI001AA0CBB4|nr:contractile injection system protein, VgrG/Pvc8 family [Lachnoanaerobaculum sp. Marseille-Q4761]MBO1869849.1 late control protein [Lachnoanaerobaculum sp. Marseille-Q4761]
MRAELLETVGFEFIDIQEFYSELLPNKHGRATIGGTISGSNKEEYLSSGGKLTQIIAKTYEGKSIVLFCGIITSCNIKSNGDVHYMTLGLMTQSIFMDGKEHIRTFQNEGVKYRDIIDIIIEGYNNSAFIMTSGDDKKTHGFMCQYKETDWEYIKRLAFSANTVIYPDYSVEGVKFFIGLPSKQENCLRSEYYELGVDSGEGSLLDSGKVYYKIAVREHYDIGERLTFLDEKLAVVARVSRLEYREVINEYILMKESDVKTKAYQNEKLIGAALFAKVSQVENELVRVSIDDDENDSDDKAFLNYATVYSSPEGGSWYCMPEVGDRVIVKFPDANEQNVYVQNAFHVGSSGGRDNPEIKFFKNKEGKEIRLSPESVLITDNNGSSIEIKDDKGISIKSNGMISIAAKTEVLIESSNAGISLTSPTSVQITQNGTQIEMNDGITHQGSKVYLG